MFHAFLPGVFLLGISDIFDCLVQCVKGNVIDGIDFTGPARNGYDSRGEWLCCDGHQMWLTASPMADQSSKLVADVLNSIGSDRPLAGDGGVQDWIFAAAHELGLVFECNRDIRSD